MVNAWGRPDRALSIRGITGQWGDFHLDPVDLEVYPREYLVLLGPSGCGKTTLMELLCGLRTPSAGRIFFGDTDITRADPADRCVGYVPQDYELFPMRSVEWNILFAPRMKKRRERDAKQQFERIVETLNLRHLLHRDVETLSGGECQRVALGRALMADPEILVLDEPVSALPESLRDSICGELKRLHLALGIATVHVSHNLDEALLLANRLAIMDVGRVVQVGTPQEILDRPLTRFVAEFSQSRNIWPVIVARGELRLGEQRICRTQAPDGQYHMVVRPEHLHLQPGGPPGEGIIGRVMESIRASHVILSKVDLGSVQAWALDERLRTPGEKVTLVVSEESISLLPR
jgi:ABC-type sugar transport system ATPase subunit